MMVGDNEPWDRDGWVVDGRPWPPEPEYMSPETQAFVMDKTDPAMCDCRHNGLPRPYHLQPCRLTLRLNIILGEN